MGPPFPYHPHNNPRKYGKLLGRGSHSGRSLEKSQLFGFPLAVPCAEAREEVGEWISKGTFLGKDGSPVILMYPGVSRFTLLC